MMSASVDTSSEFSIAIFPDTQFYAEKDNGIFEQMAQWVADNASKYNIQVLLHEGDVVQNGDESQREWEIAKQAITILNQADIPNLVALGNHDVTDYDVRHPTTFRETFPVTRYERMATNPNYETVLKAGSYADQPENAYLLMDILGEQFLFMTVEFGPRDNVVSWANDVLSNHSDRKAFLVTHSFISCDGTLVQEDSAHAPSSYPIDTTTNNGKELFDKLVYPNDNLVNVHNGHHVDGPYTATHYGQTSSGKRVSQMYQNYQDIENGGDGWFRLLTIDTETWTARMNTVSPYLGRWSSNPEEKFEFQLVNNTIDPLDDLTGIQRDILYVIGGADRPSGQDMKEKMNEYYSGDINHRRLRQNLHTLASKELVEKGEIDRRTNYYTLSDTGEQRIEERREWESEYVDL